MKPTKPSELKEPVNCRLDLIKGNIVDDFKIGNTRVLIADGYCRTPEEDEIAMKEAAKRLQPMVIADYLEQQRKGKDISQYVRYVNK